MKKGPFEKESTSISFTLKDENEETNKVSPRLQPRLDDKIYYEVGAAATTSSLRVEDPNNFETAELRISFLCVDSTSQHPTGDPVEWVRDISVKHKIMEKVDGKYMVLKSQSGVNIKYATDGSDPKDSGGSYAGRFVIGQTSVEILLGKELLVLIWAAEACDPTDVPVAIRNWLGLAPEGRWWLYTMTNAATGNIGDRRGWRKALRYALCENPVVTIFFVA